MVRVRSTSYLFPINEEVGYTFRSKRGLVQSDPLFLGLFVILMNVFFYKAW